MHARAGKLLERAAKSGGRFVTTDYVLDETATLLNARGHGRLAEAFFQTVFASRACRIEWMDPDRFAQTRQFFLKHHDKSWSFTDCFSFLVMRDLKDPRKNYLSRFCLTHTVACDLLSCMDAAVIEPIRDKFKALRAVMDERMKGRPPKRRPWVGAESRRCRRRRAWRATPLPWASRN